MIKPVASVSISKTIEKGLQALNDGKLDIALNSAIEANEIIEGHMKAGIQINILPEQYQYQY